MAGVYRPYTLADVINVLNGTDSTSTTAGGSITGLSYFAEVDENVVLGETVTASVQTPAGWGQGSWGTSAWQ